MAQHFSDENMRKLCRNLLQMRESGIGCDICFKCGPDGSTKIFAHKVVLELNSPFIQRCTENMETNPVEIHLDQDIDIDALKEVIDYFYACDIELSQEKIQNIGKVATLFENKTLLNLCQENALMCEDTSVSPEIRLKRLEDKVRQLDLLYNELINDKRPNIVVITENVQNFDLKSESWKTVEIPPMPDSGKWASAVAVGKQLYVIGGGEDKNIRNSVFIYDVREKSWAQGTPMNKPRAKLGAVFAQNVIFAIGGIGYEENAEICYNCCEIFNSTTNTWTTLDNMNNTRLAHCVVSLNDAIYAIGGYSDANQSKKSITASAECYSLSTKIWRFIPSMAVARSYAAATVFDDKIYVVGGFNETHLDSVEYFNPHNNSWTMASNLLKPRSGLGCVAYNKNLFIFGGESKTENKNYLSMDMEYFSLTKKKWEIFPYELKFGADSAAFAQINL